MFARLDVAMNDSLAVGGVERVRDFNAQADHGFGVERTAHDAVFQGLSVEEFHGDEGLAVLFINFVNGADVGMVQGRGGLRLALKTTERLLVLGDIIGQKLEGDKTAQLEVFGLVDDAHAPTAELFQNAIVGNRLAEHRSSRPILGMREGEVKEETRVRP